MELVDRSLSKSGHGHGTAAPRRRGSRALVVALLVVVMATSGACAAASLLGTPVPVPVGLPASGAVPSLVFPAADGFYHATSSVYSCVGQSASISVHIDNGWGDDMDTHFTVTVLEGYQPAGTTGGTVLGTASVTLHGADQRFGDLAGVATVGAPSDCFTVWIVASSAIQSPIGLWEIDANPV